MEKKVAFEVILALAVVSMMTMAFDVRRIRAEPGTIIVPDDYPTIQEAVNAADPGDAIYVRANTYYEHVVVNKAVSLIGESRDTTIIDGSKTGNVIHVKADNINISGFTIRYGYTAILVSDSFNSSISSNNIENWVEIIDFNPIFYGNGITLRSSSNCLISENIIQLNLRAICLSHSVNCSISENNVIANAYGILISVGSSYNLLSNNTIKYNTSYGILLERHSSNSLILGNHVEDNSYGIQLGDVLPPINAVLRNNNMTNNHYNFGLAPLAPSLYAFHDIDTSNTVDGKPIYYWINQQDKVVPADAGYVAIINSTGITVENLKLTKNVQGVLLASTANSTIRNVTATRNYQGILLSMSSDCYISGSNVCKNRRGIVLDWSSNCSITRNDVVENWSYFGSPTAGAGIELQFSSGNVIHHNNFVTDENGIKLSFSSGNVIHHNNFVRNFKQVEADAGYANSWDDGYPSGGNYWSDYAGDDWYSGPYQNETESDGMGDASYVINANNIDNYPLMKPYPWDLHDIGITRVESKSVIGQGFDFRVDVTIFNYGMFAETFNVSAYANTTIIAAFTNITLASRNSITITFTWNITGIAKGNYTLTIYATQVSEETYTADNTHKRLIIVTLLGDVNGDRKVDGKDIAVMSKHFGIRVGQPGYVSNADINCDGKVDGKDIAIASKNFGQRDP